MAQGEQDSGRDWRARLVRTPLGWGLSLVIATTGIYLLVTHTGHILAALPYLVLVACPLMHIFGHRGHGGHRGDNSYAAAANARHLRHLKLAGHVALGLTGLHGLK